jgi:cytochrome c-type biogenesis protein
MARVSLDDCNGVKSKDVRYALLVTAISFICGFTFVFVFLGLTLTAIGLFFIRYQIFFSTIAAFCIILMGLNFLGFYRVYFLSREIRFKIHCLSRGRVLSAFLMGLSFAFGWTPCIGPILGSILTFATREENIAKGACLLAIYSLGLAIPFLCVALFSGEFIRFFKNVRFYFIEKITGFVLIFFGILLLAGYMQYFSYLIIEIFPVLGRLG